MSEDLISRLRAAIEQRKHLAEAAPQGNWVAEEEEVFVADLDKPDRCDQHPPDVPNECDDRIILSAEYYDDDREGTVAHILANQPSMVLARCRADLAILDRCEKYLGAPQEESAAMMWHASRLAEATIRLLAESYGVTEEEM